MQKENPPSVSACVSVCRFICTRCNDNKDISVSSVLVWNVKCFTEYLQIYTHIYGAGVTKQMKRPRYYEKKGGNKKYKCLTALGFRSFHLNKWFLYLTAASSKHWLTFDSTLFSFFCVINNQGLLSAADSYRFGALLCVYSSRTDERRGHPVWLVTSY